MEFSHFSVMLSECIEGLAIRENGVYVDATAGGAGHSKEIVKRLNAGTLYAFDQDPDAIAVIAERLAPYADKTVVIKANFRNMKDVLLSRGIAAVDGVLLDLGVSSHQLDDAARGFSYRADAPLDMRMSKTGVSARDLVNTLSAQELSRILFEYGEEKFSRRIAGAIVSAREKAPIETTGQLVQIVSGAMPAASRREKHPCKRTFQALRIAVNEELDALSEGIDEAFELLNPGGRLVVLTFHSLEDRMVKQKFLSFAQGCTCPPDFPVCVCGKKPRAKIITRKPLLPSEDELALNSRSKSAKLRILEKLPIVSVM